MLCRTLASSVTSSGPVVLAEHLSREGLPGAGGLFPLLSSWALPRGLGASYVLPLAPAPSREQPCLTPPNSELTGVTLMASAQPHRVFTPRHVDTVGVFTPFLYEPELLHQEPVIRDLTAHLFSGLSFREKQPEFLISLALPMPPQCRGCWFNP